MSTLIDESVGVRKRVTTYGRVHRKRPQDISSQDESYGSSIEERTSLPAIDLQDRCIAIASPPSKLKLKKSDKLLNANNTNIAHRAGQSSADDVPSTSSTRDGNSYKTHPSVMSKGSKQKSVANANPAVALISPSDSDASKDSPPKRRRLGVDRVTALAKKLKTPPKQDSSSTATTTAVVNESAITNKQQTPSGSRSASSSSALLSFRSPSRITTTSMSPTEGQSLDARAQMNLVLQPKSRNRSLSRPVAHGRVVESQNISPHKTSIKRQAPATMLQVSTATSLKSRTVEVDRTTLTIPRAVSQSEDELGAIEHSPTLPAVTESKRDVWRDLLGDRHDELLRDKRTSPKRPLLRTSQSSTLPSRKRLIDTLVHHNEGVKPTFAYDSDSSTDNDAGETSNSQHANTYSQTVPLNDIGDSPNRRPILRSQSQNLLSKSVGGRMTYGQSRSMLADQVLSEKASFEIPLHDFQLSNRRTRRGSIPTLSSLPSFREHEEDSEIDGPSVRSVHELRAGGYNSRFHDEVGDLLDQIESASSSLSLRRSALLDLAAKLREKDYVRLFLLHSMQERLFSHVESERDVISGFLTISVLLVMIEEGLAGATMIQLLKQDISRLFMFLLDYDTAIASIARERKLNMSRLAQISLINYAGNVSKMKIWEDVIPDTISPRLLALKCIEAMVRQIRQTGESGNIMSTGLTTRLFDCIKLPSSNANQNAVQGIVQTATFRLALSALEAHSVTWKVIFDEDRWILDFLPIIRHTIECILSIRPAAPAQRSLSLRLALNITNNNPRAANVFAKADFLSSIIDCILHEFAFLEDNVSDDECAVVVDQLVLMLGFSINFAEWAELADACFVMLLQAEHNKIERLVDVFVENVNKVQDALSQEDVHRNIPFGYLSVMLGCLCLMPTISKTIRSKLELPHLVFAIEEFLALNNKLEPVEDGSDGNNASMAFTKRLQNMVDKLK